MIFRIQLKSEIDICFAVQQIAQIDSAPFQVYGVDLEIAPIERAIGIVVINLTLSLWILGSLYG